MIHSQLRLIALEDAPAFLDLIEKNRARLQPYFPVSTIKIKDLASAEDYITQKIRQAGERTLYCWVMEGLESHQLIGVCFIKSIDWRVPKCELAYYVGQKFEKKGLSSKMVREVLNYCFDELKMEKVFLRIDPKNIGSQRVAIKNGFEQEGYLHNEFRTGTGELIDVLYFAKLREVK
ncbi:MAG: GNAT family N-acetyltransferase [Aureispira sp.]|nr:GNAT family N-acetyltransferase [Aureispira sp.]